MLAWRQFGGESKYHIAADRAFMCAECGHVFEHTIQMGEKEPLECPACGKLAAYIPEKCYWTKDENGKWKAKLEPTFVILNKRMGIDKKTYCPDCGREVVGHNPMPPKELMDAARAEADK